MSRGKGARSDSNALDDVERLFSLLGGLDSGDISAADLFNDAAGDNKDVVDTTAEETPAEKHTLKSVPKPSAKPDAR